MVETISRGRRGGGAAPAGTDDPARDGLTATVRPQVLGRADPGRDANVGVMTTSPLIDRPRPATRGPGDQPGNQQAGAARTVGRVPVPADRLINRAALAALLVGTAALYLWGLGESGWANSFYSAAAQAGSESWSALFFGASDAAGSITVDKTPLALWPMALSVKVFGLSSWSILVPQALEGVAAVWLLHAAVRRTTGSAGAGLLAGARAGADAGGGADVPVQQPGRVAGAAAASGRRTRPNGPSRATRPCGGSPSRVPSSGSPSWPRCCRRSWCSPPWRWPTCSSRRSPGAGASVTCWSRSARWSSPAAGGSRSCRCGPRTRGPTSAARRTTRSSS